MSEPRLICATGGIKPTECGLICTSNARHFVFLALSFAEAFGHNSFQAFQRFERIGPYCFQSGDCALIQVGPHHLDQAKSGKSFLPCQNPYFGAKTICPANKLCSGTSMQPELIDDGDLS